jgi:hypothetical protein
MKAPRLPAIERVKESLAVHLRLADRRGIVTHITELTSGLGGARLFRVHLSPGGKSDGETYAGSLPPSVILKVPDAGGHTGIAPRDPLVATREVSFYESGIGERLPFGLRPPRLLGIDRLDHGSCRRTWLWTEDVAAALAVRWDPPRLLQAAECAA